jgi:hypothetical protein
MSQFQDSPVLSPITLLKVLLQKWLSCPIYEQFWSFQWFFDAHNSIGTDQQPRMVSDDIAFRL